MNELLTKLEAVEALADAVGMRSICLNVFTEKLACRDAFPLEVLGESFKVFLTACARSTEQEDAAN